MVILLHQCVLTGLGVDNLYYTSLYYKNKPTNQQTKTHLVLVGKLHIPEMLDFGVDAASCLLGEGKESILSVYRYLLIREEDCTGDDYLSLITYSSLFHCNRSAGHTVSELHVSQLPLHLGIVMKVCSSDWFQCSVWVGIMGVTTDAGYKNSQTCPFMLFLTFHWAGMLIIKGVQKNIGNHVL